MCVRVCVCVLISFGYISSVCVCAFRQRRLFGLEMWAGGEVGLRVYISI